MDEYVTKSAVFKALLDALADEKSAFDSINGIHAADVRPVVRCKDCRHRDPEDHKCDCGQLERAGCVFPVDDDYFCSYGEKMEGGE